MAHDFKLPSGSEDLLAGVWRKAREGRSAEDPIARFREYDDDWLRFCEEVLGQRHWKFQRDFIRAVQERHHVTVRACHKCSKSHTITELALAFMCTAPSIVLAIMPGEKQLTDVIFANLNKMHAEAQIALPGRVTTTGWYIGPGHYMRGLATNDPQRAHGRHAGVDVPPDPDKDLEDQEVHPASHAITKALDGAAASSRPTRILVIYDEAPAVAQFAFDGTRGTLASPYAYSVFAGNPLQSPSAQHDYARSFKNGSKFYRMHVSAVPVPDDPDPADIRYDHVPSWIMPRAWPEQQVVECGGRDTPLYKGKVLGMFSRAMGEEYVVTEQMLRNALTRPPTLFNGPRMGVDIARNGDRCAASLFWNGRKVAQHIWNPSSSDETGLMSVATTILRLSRHWGEHLQGAGLAWDGQPIPAYAVSCDATGIGLGVVDRLAQLEFHVDRVNFGAQPSDHYIELQGQFEFPNERCRMYYTFRRLLQMNMIQIPEVFDISWDEAQWAMCKDEPSRGGITFTVEPNLAIMKRHSRSPDVHTADLLAATRETRTSERLIRFASTTGRKAREAFG